MGTPADTQKLIAYGKQLDDNSKTLVEFGVKENDFLVLFVSKVALISNFVAKSCQ